MISISILIFFFQLIAGDSGVTQSPSILMVSNGKPAEMHCKHDMGSTYRYMYWFQQHQGKSMKLIATTTAFTEPDFGPFNGTKFSADKKEAESGSFTVNDVDSTDNAVYFCAVSEHSVTDLLHHCTKTPVLILL
ncbi:hypothetical protein AMEX_G17867 [Astyanax mexicanus]|uniref:Ig-like domain-containing protein n=1 Tax=Astyanax mexicanus TaxID=7994 RepID=A0A8T2LJ01_ASTMX|nr:hypothetical protein AMEX_G17867 [Astyanax mexicanus]